MDTTEVTLQVLPDYQLKLSFPNGSAAVIAIKRSVPYDSIWAVLFAGIVSHGSVEDAQKVGI